MGEMRSRAILAQDLQSQTSESYNSLSHFWSEKSRATSHATSWIHLGYGSHSKVSEPTAENIQRPPNLVAMISQEQITVCPGPFVRKNICNEVKFPLSRFKGDDQSFDLEHPADVYHGAVALTSSPPNKCPYTLPASDSGDLSGFNLNSRKKTCFIDLNEPMQLESLHSSSATPFETYTSREEIMHSDPYVAVEAIPKFVGSKQQVGDLNCDRISDGINSLVAFDLNCLPVSCFSEPETTVALDCSFANDHATRKQKCVEDSPVLHTRIDDKFLNTETCIDLNNSVVEYNPSPLVPSSTLQIKSAGNTELKGPTSPENEESSPPRGKSEDILLSKQGEGELSMEPHVIAAQSLIMISSSGVQEYMKASNADPLVEVGDSLCWFAEIASSIGVDLENEIKKLGNGAADNDQGDISHGVFDFQEITEENTAKYSLVVKKRKGKGPARGMREGFLETASLKRKPGTKASAKPGKYSKLFPSDVVKKSVRSTLKQPDTRSKQGVFKGWGTIRKREGGRRRAIKFLALS